MSDLIDRQAVYHMLDEIGEDFDSLREAVVLVDCIADMVADLPSVTPTEIIRCKDCKWFKRIGCAIQIVDDNDRPTEEDFCSFAERKDTNETPTERTGHWITTRTFMHDGEYYCDKCKCDAPNNEKWDYCPNCGCKMVEPQESEDKV